MGERELQIKILAISGILASFKEGKVKPDVDIIRLLKYLEKSIETFTGIENNGDGGEEFLNNLLNELLDEVLQ